VSAQRSGAVLLAFDSVNEPPGSPPRSILIVRVTLTGVHILSVIVGLSRVIFGGTR